MGTTDRNQLRQRLRLQLQLKLNPMHIRVARNHQLDNAIASVPKHGYAWASSVQSKDLLPALDYELLDSRRRESEGFVQESRPNKVLSLPARNQALKKYEALVLDCEMVEFKDHISDLVRISVVDFLTGETVLNAFVQPTGHVRD
jgi:hypothetical protein